MLGKFAWRLLHGFCRHPGDARLLAFLDGELSDKHRAHVMKHIKNCDQCHTRSVQLEHEWKYFAELSVASSAKPLLAEKELIAKIRAAAHDWNAENPLRSGPPQDSEKTETDRQLAAVLGIYLGQRAAAALLNTGDSAAFSREERLAGAEAALLILLGRKGFAAVEMRLLKIMEELPKSASGPSQS